MQPQAVPAPKSFAMPTINESREQDWYMQRRFLDSENNSCPILPVTGVHPRTPTQLETRIVMDLKQIAATFLTMALAATPAFAAKSGAVARGGPAAGAPVAPAAPVDPGAAPAAPAAPAVPAARPARGGGHPAPA